VLSGRDRRITQQLRENRGLVYEKLSDPILVTRAKDGDRLALEALCARHAPKVERLAHQILRDPEDASDAAQEALAKLCVRLKQFRGDSQFSTWLHRLVVNTCWDAAERSKTRVHEPLAEDLSSGPEHDPVRVAGMSELRRELCDSLAGVSPQQAQVVLLKDALGYSFEEIA
jgi:RNA polymerase sigma-70 factor (ECF subfamily)